MEFYMQLYYLLTYTDIAIYHLLLHQQQIFHSSSLLYIHYSHLIDLKIKSAFHLAWYEEHLGH